MKCSLTRINARLTIDSDSKDSKKVAAAEVSVEMISSPCFLVVAPHSVVVVIEVITDQEEVKMLVMNFVLLLKIFIMERQRNWLFKDKLFAKNAQEGRYWCTSEMPCLPRIWRSSSNPKNGPNGSTDSI